MSESGLKPIAEEAETTAEKYIDPTGPETSPDPLPSDLQPDEATQQGFEDENPMEDEAPTG